MGQLSDIAAIIGGLTAIIVATLPIIRWIVRNVIMEDSATLNRIEERQRRIEKRLKNIERLVTVDSEEKR